MSKEIVDHVSFRAEFPREHSPAAPAGSELLDQIERQLPQHGIDVLSRWHTDYSHCLLLGVNGVSFKLELGYVSDENAQWLMYFMPKSCCSKVFKAFRGNSYKKVALAINDILKASSSVSDIRWYKNMGNWNNHPERFFVIDDQGKVIKGYPLADSVQ
jgi:hypothetical protein